MTITTPLRSIVSPLAAAGQVPSDLLQDLLTAASGEEAGTQPIGRSIDLLRAAGMLTDDGATDPAATARALMRVGGANLSVGRLWEGHINALRLIGLYGAPQLKGTVRRQIANGAVLGVWGADGEVPVAPSDGHLTGNKCYASGLGTVSHAVVTVSSGPQVRLALIDVTNMKRADASVWQMPGMKATASGTYDFTDLPVDALNWVGDPGDYLNEPHFVGGVWRIAALQVGAAAGLLDRAAARLRAMGRMQAEPQKARLMTVLMRAWAGMALVERAASATMDRDMTAEQVVSAAIAARLFTEDVALDTIRAVEQSLGLQHFSADADTGRMARDLSVYLRQAARDAFMQRAADFALGKENNIRGIFE